MKSLLPSLQLHQVTIPSLHSHILWCVNNRVIITLREVNPLQITPSEQFRFAFELQPDVI